MELPLWTFPRVLLSSPQLGSFQLRADLAGLGHISTTLFPVGASHTGAAFSEPPLPAAFWGNGKGTAGPAPRHGGKRSHAHILRSHTPVVTLCCRTAAWTRPHGPELRPSDRTARFQNLELCLWSLHLTKFTSKKEQPVWQPATLCLSHLIYFPSLQNVPSFIPSDSHTPDNKRVKAHSADRHILSLYSVTFSFQLYC